MPSSGGSSRPRDELNLHLFTCALASRFFTTSATWEAPSFTGTCTNILNPAKSFADFERRQEVRKIEGEQHIAVMIFVFA